MSADFGTDSTPFAPDDARWMFPDSHEGVEPAREPGIVIHQAGATAIRSAWYRPKNPVEFDQPQTQDTIPLLNGVVTGHNEPIGPRKVGAEAEVFVIDEATGEGVSVSPIKHIADGEFLQSQLEVMTRPGVSAAQVSLGLSSRLLRVNKRVKRDGAVALEPASTLAHRLPTSEDVRREDMYVARQHDIHPSFEGCNVAGIHVHIDVPIQYLNDIMNRIRLVLEVASTALHSGPYTFGETKPRLGEIYDNDRLKPHDGSSLSSARGLVRLACLDYGMIGEKVAFEDLDGLLAHSESRLLERKSNHIDRAVGEHADVRPRVSVVGKKDGYARLEICALDTGAYRHQTNAAVIDLIMATVSRLEGFAAKGEAEIDRLHAEHPDLFGPHGDAGSIQGNLHVAEENAIETAYAGFDAGTTDFTGAKTTTRHQFEQLLEFAYSPDGAPRRNAKAFRAILRNAAMSKKDLRSVMRATGKGNPPSLTGYYKTGAGTASDWIKAYHEAMAEAAPADAWRLSAKDRAESFDAHLESIAHTRRKNIRAKKTRGDIY